MRDIVCVCVSVYIPINVRMGKGIIVRVCVSYKEIQTIYQREILYKRG